jgi:hypothetical protein
MPYSWRPLKALKRWRQRSYDKKIGPVFSLLMAEEQVLERRGDGDQA